MGLEPSKYLLIVDLLDLQIDIKSIPSNSLFKEGCTFSVSLEKKSRSSTSMKKELRFDAAGINPMKADTSSLPAVVPLADRLQMVITLYKDLKKEHSFQQKSASLKLNVIKQDGHVGVDIAIPVAFQTLKISDYASDGEGAPIGHEVTLKFDKLPNSTIKAVIKLVPIDNPHATPVSDQEDNHSVSSNPDDSDVGFDYDDLIEPVTPISDAPGSDIKRKPAARRASYLADDTATPPTPQRRRSLIIQRTKSHVSSLFAQIKEEEEDETEFDLKSQDLVEEVACRLSYASPPFESPSFSRRSRSRGNSRATPSSAARGMRGEDLSKHLSPVLIDLCLVDHHAITNII